MDKMNEAENKQWEPNRSAKWVDGINQGLANSIHNINIDDPPATTYDQRVTAYGQQAVAYSQGVLVFNKRAQACKRARDTGTEPPKQKRVFKSREQREKEEKEIVQAWKDYFGAGTYEDWARLCRDLGLEGDLSTKFGCRMVRMPTHTIRWLMCTYHD